MGYFMVGSRFRFLWDRVVKIGWICVIRIFVLL